MIEDAHAELVTGFKDAMAELASGVSLLTVHVPVDLLDLGMTITSLTSASLEPPMVCAAIGRGTSLAPYLLPGARVGLSILAADQHELGADFSRKGRSSAADILKERPHRRGELTNALLADGSLAQLEGVVEQNLFAGDHSLVVIAVLSAHTPVSGDPALAYHRRAYTRTDC